jgi:hypothetical protein
MLLLKMLQGRLMEEEYNSVLSINAHSHGNCFGFDEALHCTFEHITDALKKLGSSGTGYSLPEESAENITSWKFLFDSLVADLRLDLLCEKILKTFFCAVSYLLQSLIYSLAVLL